MLVRGFFYVVRPFVGAGDEAGKMPTLHLALGLVESIIRADSVKLLVVKDFIKPYPSILKTKNAGFGGLRFLTNTHRDTRNSTISDRCAVKTFKIY